jgi:hypothetical protein
MISCANGKHQQSWERGGMRTLVSLVVLLVSTTLAGAAEDVAAGQAVIRSQERAFGRNDAATAYSFASPFIRIRYLNPEAFLQMVRNDYAPVYRHRGFTMGGARISEGKILQEVHIVDIEGVSWQAVYTLEPQPGGGLKISGCVLSKLGIALARTGTHRDHPAVSSQVLRARPAKLAPASVEPVKAPAKQIPAPVKAITTPAEQIPSSVEVKKTPSEPAFDPNYVPAASSVPLPASPPAPRQEPAFDPNYVPAASSVPLPASPPASREEPAFDPNYVPAASSVPLPASPPASREEPAFDPNYVPAPSSVPLPALPAQTAPGPAAVDSLND